MLAGWGGHTSWCVPAGWVARMRLQLGCISLATRLQLGSFAVLCFSPRDRRIMHIQGYLSGMCAEEAGTERSKGKAIACPAGLHPGF